MSNIRNKGSATIEAAIILPLLISVLLILASVIQCFIALNCINSALCKTADFMSENACIYHEKGIKELENKLLEAIGNKLDITSFSEPLKFLNIRGVFEETDDLVYQCMAKELFKYYLNKDELYNKGFIKFNDISFSGSYFFRGNENINLIVKCKMKLPIPLPEKILKGYVIQSKIKVRGWINGDDPLYKGKKGSDVTNVWSLNNFERGVIIREKFGGNLPLNHPVIACFREGKASMIKSLDHTADTYQSAMTFKLSIQAMINILSGFTGTETIKPEDILKRELILVLPENELSPDQKSVLDELLSECKVKNIVLTIHRYQVKK